MLVIVNVTYKCCYGSLNFDIEIEKIQDESLEAYEARIDNIAHQVLVNQIQNHSELESYT